MKIKLKCTYSGNPAKHGEPGDIIDLPKAEAQRLLDLKAAEIATEAEAKAAELKQDGPTIEEFVKAGFAPENYPPAGYASRSTPQEIEAAIAAAKSGKA